MQFSINIFLANKQSLSNFLLINHVEFSIYVYKYYEEASSWSLCSDTSAFLRAGYDSLYS